MYVRRHCHDDNNKEQYHDIIIKNKTCVSEFQNGERERERERERLVSCLLCLIEK